MVRKSTIKAKEIQRTTEEKKSTLSTKEKGVTVLYTWENFKKDTNHEFFDEMSPAETVDFVSKKSVEKYIEALSTDDRLRAELLQIDPESAIRAFRKEALKIQPYPYSMSVSDLDL